MGFSTPKKPFDLKEFLGQKATRVGSRPRWNRGRAAQTEPDADAASPELTEAESTTTKRET